MANLRDYVESVVGNRVNNWISMKREEISLDNSALFKGKDIRFVYEVSSYLEQFGLVPQLEGSAKENAENGNPRVYGDIDLLAFHESLGGRPAPLASREAVARLVRASKGIEFINDWEVENISAPEMNNCYVGHVIDYRFKIRSPKTNTIIDLNFGKSNNP